MKIIEVGTGYTSIPASMGAATEIVVEELSKVFEKDNINYEIFDIKDENRIKTNLKIKEVNVPKIFRKKDTTLGIMHKLKRVVYSLSLAKALRNEIKSSIEEISIHFHNQYNMFFFLKTTSKKLRQKVKIYYTVHSYIWSNTWEDIQSTIRKKYFQEVYSVRNADKIFVLNKTTIKHFVEHLNINSEKIVLIDNGVNIDIYKPQYEKNDKITFFHSGSVCDRKNQMECVQRLSNYMKNDKNIEFLYAGGIIEQEYKQCIDNFVNENGLQQQVTYLGELSPGEEIGKYYRNSKAFIFPSKQESFGMVILEAMASGLPVIMNNKSILDILGKLKDVILFYEDQKSFNDIIENKILNETERMKIATLSRQIVEQEYSWDTVAHRYEIEMSKMIKEY